MDMSNVTEMLDKKDEEIERLSDLNKVKNALIKAYAKKIGMLLKEKEWLIDRATQAQFLTGLDGRRKQLINKMQQALKEK